jgi:tetratricopeptide (TPR) repeat protein
MRSVKRQGDKQVRSPARPQRRSRRSLLAVTVLVLAGALAVAFCFWWSASSKPPAPPLIDLTAIDPAVRRAVDNARTAVLQNSQSADAWGKLGMIIQSHGLSPEVANACFVEAERLDPHKPCWPYYQAIAVVNTDPEAALPKLRQTVQLCDCTPDAPRLQLAEVLLDLGRLDEAARHLERVLQQEPGNARAFLDLGRIASEQGELDKTISQLDRAVADPHTRKAARILLAQTYERLGNKTAAEQELHRAQELPNDLVWPDPYKDDLVNLRVGKQIALAHADQLIHQGHYVQAVQLLQRVVQEYPDAAWAWVMMGRAHLGKKDYGAAEQALHKATELGPELAEAQFYLGVAYFFQKNYAAATTCFRKATQLKPDFALAYYNLGHSLKEQGDDMGALAAFRTAISCQPEYAAAHYNLAMLLVKKGQWDEALVHLRHAVQLNPADPQARKLLEQVEKKVTP